METVIVEGELAIDMVMGIPHNAVVMESESGRCCDIGYWEHEERESDRESLLWSVLNWRKEPERFEIEFVENHFGAPNWEHAVEFRIFAGDACEPNTYFFRFVPPKYLD